MANDIDERVSRCERAIFMIAAAVHEAVLLALKDMEGGGDAAGEDEGDAAGEDEGEGEGGEGMAETPAPVAQASAPAPAAETPAPVAQASAPAPAAETPAPVAQAPAPAAEAPAPVAQASAPAPAETPAPVADKFPPHPSIKYTYDETAAVLTEHVNELGAPETSRILAQFKVSRLTELVPSQYPALVEALRKNMAEKADEKSGDENAFL